MPVYPAVMIESSFSKATPRATAAVFPLVVPKSLVKIPCNPNVESSEPLGLNRWTIIPAVELPSWPATMISPLVGSSNPFSASSVVRR